MDKERPLLLPFAAMLSGLVVSQCLGVLLPFWVVAAIFVCLVVSVPLPSEILFRTCVLLFFMVWGLYALTPWNRPDQSEYSIVRHAHGRPVIIEGVIVTRPVARAAESVVSTSFVLRTEAVVEKQQYHQAGGRLLVRVDAGDPGFMRGDRIRISARVRVPHKLGLPGEFDYPAYLALQGISATAHVPGPERMLLMRGAAQDSLLRRIDTLAERLGGYIRTVVPDERESSVLVALLLGDQKRIPAALGEAYNRAGVVHILSISGFHIGVIAFFVVHLALLMLSRSEYLAIRFNLRRVTLLLSLPAMVIYMLMAGSAPATVRSVIMLAIFVAVLYAEREPDPVNALLLSAFLMVLCDPVAPFDISFQLSFLALWGIVLVTPVCSRVTAGFRYCWLRFPFMLLVSSLAATLATAVPVLFHFNQTSFNGILANFLIVPLLGYGAVLIGFCALPFVMVCPLLAEPLFRLAAWLVFLSNNIIELFAKMPLLRFHGVTPLDYVLLLLFMGGLSFVKPQRLKNILCSAIPVLALLVHLVGTSGADGRLHLTMLSVGQAESLLLKLPDGKTMLVDGGGYLYDNGYDFGQRVLAPALLKLGIHRIDRMLLTHCHPDHIGGLPYVARSFPVGQLIENQPGEGKQYVELVAALAAQGTPTLRVASGERLELAEGVVMEVLSPARERNPVQDMNEDSLVFRISYGNNSILFMADAGHRAEMDMLERRLPVKSDVLKVGHHGSRHSTSEEFLKRVSPSLALISAGRENRFGLPSQETLGLLARHGVRVYRTDQDGTVELSSDGQGWQVQTRFRPQ